MVTLDGARTNTAMRTKRWVLWGFLPATFIGLAAWVGFVEANAEAKARAFCERFPPGSSLADAAAAARGVGDQRHRIIRAGEISIAYIGVPPFSRHVCTLEVQSSKVTSAWYAYLG